MDDPTATVLCLFFPFWIFITFYTALLKTCLSMMKLVYAILCWIILIMCAALALDLSLLYLKYGYNRYASEMIVIANALSKNTT